MGFKLVKLFIEIVDKICTSDIKYKCFIRQTWVKINTPDGYKGQDVRKGINQQTKITRNNLSHTIKLF
jgi:hypothetical protein